MIPRNFHFVFGLKPQFEPFHLAYYLCLKSCLEVNQPDQIFFYHHYEPHGKWWQKIKPYLELVKVDLVSFVTDHPAYLPHQKGHFIRTMNLDYAHQADFVRLKMLIERGGVYADIDTLFINPMPDSLWEHEFVVGEEGYIDDKDGVPQRSICNALMLSAREANFPKRWIENMYKVFDGSWSRHSNIEASRLAEKHPDEITVVPQNYFYKHSFSPEGIAILFEGLDTDLDNVYSMHLWNHLWWDKHRVDFSHFHAELLTEDYIRNANTTYSIVARRFLD